MLDSNRHLQIFNPLELNTDIHIVGVGATGANVAVYLTRLGVKKLHIWDYDTVENHNLTNQVYFNNQIGMKKTTALKDILLKINDEIIVVEHDKYTSEFLSGIVINAVDSIELRYQLYLSNQYNKNIKLMIDPRLGTRTSQIHAIKWEPKAIEKLISLTDFKDSEMEYERSACGTPLNIITTVLITAQNIISIIINFCNNEEFPSDMYMEALKFKTQTFYY